MMLELNIVTNGLQRYKPRAFVFPFYRCNNKLKKRGIYTNIYHSPPLEDIQDCDILLIQDEVVRHNNDFDLTLNDLDRLQASVDTLIFYDTDDSTGNIRSKELSIVDYYFKSQLLNNRDRYLEPMYGSCLFTDYYHNKFEVTDEDEAYSVPIASKSDLSKLRVGWNIGIVPKIFLPYNNRGWRVIESIPNKVYQYFPWNTVFGASLIWKSPASKRSVTVSGRFSTSYHRSTVEYHRKRMADKLKDYFDPKKVSVTDYWRELRNAQILLSPFGLGEVCHRDFEGFLSGNILLKPKMNHLETWPPLFDAGETYVDVSWDMNDAEQKLNTVLDNYHEYQSIAEEGQRRYREYLVGETATERFVNHFETLVKST